MQYATHHYLPEGRILKSNNTARANTRQKVTKYDTGKRTAAVGFLQCERADLRVTVPTVFRGDNTNRLAVVRTLQRRRLAIADGRAKW